jgi:hypothetical protein
MPSLSLTRTDIREYSQKHGYAQLMFCGAGDDYAAARCLTFNSLIDSGFPLFCQSIEKLLKALIYIETGSKPSAKGSDRHNPYALKEELKQKKATDYGLDAYDDILKKLFGHYQHRYHDNIAQSESMSGNEVDKIDELWVYMFEMLAFPIAVKFRLKFLAMMFEDNILRLMPSYRHWVTFQNKAIMPKISEMGKPIKRSLSTMFSPQANRFSRSATSCAHHVL